MKRCIQVVLAVLLATALTGCGGGMRQSSISASGLGRATFTIRWPDRTRLIPLAANSILVAVKQNTTTVAHQLLPRPANGGQSSLVFDSLPIGTSTITATAFPNADGSGIAQTTATIPLTIRANQTTSFSLTMASTIDHLELTAPRTTIVIGGTLQLGVTAKDAGGSVVLLSPSKLQWLSSNAAIAKVDAAGLVTGVAAGSADISVTDTESGKSAKLTLLVKTLSPISFQAPVLYPVQSGNRLLSADFDGDGNPDLVVGTDSSLLVLYGTGGGTFGTAQTILTWTGGVVPCSVADMNGDGRPDIVCTVPGQFIVVHNLGSRAFADPIAVALNNIGPLLTGDFNGDGKPDIAVATSNPGSTVTDVHIFQNNGGGNYTEVSGFRNIWIIVAMRTADLDGDGKLDLVLSIVTDIVGGSGVNVYWGDGTGRFIGGPGAGTSSFNVAWTTIADFNSDGKPDIALANTTGGGIFVIPNTGSRTLGTPAFYGGPSGPDNMESPDLDGDGKPDIIARSGPGITVLRNQNGLFPNFKDVLAGGNTISMTVGDFNLDGKPDVALTTDAGISILLNNTP